MEIKYPKRILHLENTSQVFGSKLEVNNKMANDNNRQVTAADIKGDLAQRLRCPGCTRTFAQVEGRNKIELDRKETMDGTRRAITFVCNECKDKDTPPVFAFRLVGGLIQEIRIEDLPDLSPTKSTARAAKRQGTNTRRRRSSKNTPTQSPTSEDARGAASPIAPSIEEEDI
jgi:hypothetical protein